MAEYLLCGEFGLGFDHKCFPVTSGYQGYLLHPKHQLALFKDYHHTLKTLSYCFCDFCIKGNYGWASFSAAHEMKRAADHHFPSGQA